MISLDTYLIEFLKGNWVTLGLLFAILKGLAEISSFEWDNKLLDLIKAAVSPFSPKK